MTINSIQIFITFVGGLGLFIYGMHEMGSGLQNAAGKKMQHLLEVLTKNRFMGVLTGAFVTMAVQSSSATTVMIVGFVNARLMSLTQSVGIIMGANIGTTTTSWIVAASEWAVFLKPTVIAPITVAVGVVLTLASKKDKFQYTGQILIGFGILFIGISGMSDAVAPLKDLPAFQKAFIRLGTNPILGVLAGALVTCALQSSSASVSVLQSLAVVGLIPWSAAVYIILGQNIGTCITAILSSVGASKNAKAASYIHLVFNIFGSLIFLVGAVIYFYFINPTFAMQVVDRTQIATFHTVFNICATIILFPFAKTLVKIASKMAGIGENEEETNAVTKQSHLDDRLLENHSIAVSVSLKEILRMGESSLKGLDLVQNAIIDKQQSSIESLFSIETEINEYERDITNFLTKLIRKPLLDKEKDVITSYFHIVSDLERVGDHLENIAELANVLVEENMAFSDSGKVELINLIETTKKCVALSLEALKETNKSKATKAILLEEKTDELVKLYHDNHIARLSIEDCEVKVGFIFLEVLTNLERVADHADNICEFVINNM